MIGVIGDRSPSPRVRRRRDLFHESAQLLDLMAVNGVVAHADLEAVVVGRDCASR